MTPHSIHDLVLQSLDSDKAIDIIDIPLDDQSGIADNIIIASGTSSRHVASMAEKLKDRLSISGFKGVKIEGISQADWVVIDAGDVVIHLFRPEVREFYNIERMWGAHVPAPHIPTSDHHAVM